MALTGRSHKRKSESCFLVAVLLQRRPAGSNHGAWPKRHDLKAPMPQGLAVGHCHVVSPACAEDLQKQGPVHQSVACVQTHPDHSEIPHGEGPTAPKPDGAAPSTRRDHWDLSGSTEAEQVRWGPAGRWAVAAGVMLQVPPLPQETLGTPGRGTALLKNSSWPPS